MFEGDHVVDLIADLARGADGGWLVAMLNGTLTALLLSCGALRCIYHHGLLLCLLLLLRGSCPRVAHCLMILWLLEALRRWHRSAAAARSSSGLLLGGLRGFLRSRVFAGHLY